MSHFDDTFDLDATIPDDFQLRELTPGLTLCEKYRLEKEAGAGGMGIVWKAWDLIGERWVALKFIPPEIRHSESAMAQVKTVFQTVQALNHQNIGPVYGLEKDETFGYFIVKKWLDGQTLDEMKLPPERIPEVLAKVADALDYAHSKRVMHRDVKPSNIFIETNGDVLLIDFGLAAEIQNSISQNTSSTACRTSGTRPYMAPEQWRGQFQDGQTDQYALGVVAYQLYSGRLPFQIHDVAILRMAVLQDQPEPIKNIPPNMNAAIMCALSKDRKDRFATCREFINALTGVTFSEPSTQPPVYDDSLVYDDINARIAEEKAEEEAKRQEEQENFHEETTFPETIIHIINGSNVNFKCSMNQGTSNGKPHKMGSGTAAPGVLTPGSRQVLQADGIEYAFRWCPPGEFMMGRESMFSSDTSPVHRVTLTQGFWLLETPVTQAMWMKLMGKNPSYHQKGLFIPANNFQKPVEQVRWKKCRDFCHQLGQKLGRTIKLPTEAQWEYACRAGTTGDYAGDLDSMAWYMFNSSSVTQEVRMKRPNNWGLYDMHGNVWEWCADFYAKNYYSKSPSIDPENTSWSSNRVIRGGCCISPTNYCTSASRYSCATFASHCCLGFRVLMFPDPSDEAETAPSGENVFSHFPEIFNSTFPF
ncbi:MAG: SUMF1/EgtB/PvdO family nonheme iron enzyme [Thermoguttaceae bacterium]|nr:SUMF1/EgtB/PvdO family nonheme iron enzyme [Thermoguttaceae bacterium]